MQALGVGEAPQGAAEEEAVQAAEDATDEAGELVQKSEHRVAPEGGGFPTPPFGKHSRHWGKPIWLRLGRDRAISPLLAPQLLHFQSVVA